MKLFAVLLGGRANGCNIELHDVVFVAGRTLEETYPKLIGKWFGSKKRLHIDSTVELKYVDGHEIVISREAPADDKKLFFVNFGAYKPGYFGEVHETAFYVGTSKPEVLARAKEELCLALMERHCDDNLSIDDIISVYEIDQHHIHLIPTTEPAELNIISEYRRLDMPEIF
ncbi:hypothetical protein AQUSIP_03180 [Aquicella siphonis]|uniref:DUF1543 domain-containing protein n=1 Tax=Aquicella siphonis TaxID=254247 RepID=A0A5E4PF38_9COXI|nr:DUF1543 domain-containing protein [Aquicella siphonis]VVC75043.1 hypothetical protein AQUSIP_03180 [Aquicella siphonis]